MSHNGKTHGKQTADLHRLLWILTLVRARPDWTARRLAAELGVAERTIYRDVEKLRAVGFALAHDPRSGGYRLEGECFLPPLQLTCDEALALTVLCEDIAGRGQIAMMGPAYRALQKVEAQLPSPLREEVWRVMDHIAIRTAPAEPDEARSNVYETMRAAIGARRAVRCAYASTRGRGRGRPFLFEPYALLFSVRAWYALGLHRGHGEVRCLKLARFASATLTDRRYEIPEDFSVEAHLGNAWRLIPGEREFEVEILFDPEFAETVAETRWHATQRLERHDDGSMTFRCTVSGLDEIVWWVLSMGPHARVVRPPELAERVRELARGVAELYRPAARAAAAGGRRR